MNELKFRFYRKDLGMSKEPGDIYSLGITLLEGIEPDAIMQYINLKDKNSKEIYEGDIVRCFGLDDDYYNTAVVFKNGAFGYITPMLKDFISFAQNDNFSWNNGQSDKILIIGNIFENPELLKAAEDE